MKITLVAAVSLLSWCTSMALTPPSVKGDYLEVRSCDIYTGPCFANAEMGTAGKEAMMVWSVKEGSWEGTSLDGLSVIAVVRSAETLGNLKYEPRSGKAVLIVDDKASPSQQEALKSLARAMAGKLIGEVTSVQTSNIEARLGSCSKTACAAVKAGDLVHIATRCFGDDDHVCGNEDIFYPPLTDVSTPLPAYTELASFNARGLDSTWQFTGQRSAFLASFAR